MISQRQKNFKKHWLKRPKVVPQKTISGIRFYICRDIPVDIIRVIFNFRFSSRKCQSQQKLPKKITHFPIQFIKTSLILQTSAHLTLKIICSRNTAKKISGFTNFPVNTFLSGVKMFEKNIFVRND